MAIDIYFLNKTKKQIICSKLLYNDFEDRNQIITYLANCLGDTIEIKRESEVEDIIYNKNKEIIVYESDDTYGIPKKPKNFLKFWESKLNKIPDKYINSANVDINANSCYDAPYITIRISYWRPETEEEGMKRLKAENKQFEIDKERDFKKIKSLKIKYGLL